MRRGNESDAGSVERRIPGDREDFAARMGVQTSRIEDLGRIGADARVQAPRAVEKKAEVVRHHLLAVEHMGKRRTIRPGWVRSLQWLVELLRIAEQHEVRGARRRGDRVRERHLAGFVDEQRVDAPDHVVPRPQPGGAAEHTLSVPSPRPSRAAALFLRWIASGYVRPSLPGFWPIATWTPHSCAMLAVFSSNSPITLWLFAVTPTRFPAATRSTIIRAPTVLFPDPGGPWIAR